MQLCGFEVGLNRPFILLAGPCVIESEQLTLDIAGKEFTYQIPLSIELNSNPYINAADQNPL